jgi:hypothetical protein
MEYRCPIYESSKFLCGRPAKFLVAGTALCMYHARNAALVVKTGDPLGQAIITSDPARQAATRNREGNHA